MVVRLFFIITVIYQGNSQFDSHPGQGIINTMLVGFVIKFVRDLPHCLTIMVVRQNLQVKGDSVVSHTVEQIGQTTKHVKSISIL